MRPVPTRETLTDAALSWQLRVPASDHPVFAGHFPGYPLLPGVIILGWMLAGAERFLGRELSPPTRLHNVKFQVVLRPDEEVELTVTRGTAGGGGGRLLLNARVTSAAGVHATVVVEPVG